MMLIDPTSKPVVVGVVFSSENLSSLTAFLALVPSEVAVVVLPTEATSSVPQDLGFTSLKSTFLPTPVTRPIAPQAGRLYWAGAGWVLTWKDGSLTPRRRGRSVEPSMVFFQGLTDEEGSRAVAIHFEPLSSAYASDLTVLTEAGGLALTIDSPASFDTALHQLKEHLHWHRQPLSTHQAILDRIFQILTTTTGSDFSHYKASTINRRLAQRAASLHFADLEDYLKHLETTSDEVKTLVSYLLIGVTAFFRDTEAFQALAPHLSQTIARCRVEQRPLRVWVPACSTGEECYSLAMLIQEEILATGGGVPFQIFATDVEAGAVETARRGWYPTATVEAIPEPLRNRYLTSENRGWRINKSLREAVIFAQHNLTADPPYSQLDLISCRNLLIYLTPAAQKKLFTLFAYALIPHGLLLLGRSESIDSRSPYFSAIDKKHKLFTRKEGIKALPVALGRKTPPIPPKLTPEPVHANRNPEANFKETVANVLTQEYTPPGVLTDANGEILFLWGVTSQIFQRRNGKPSNNIVENVVNTFRIAVANSLEQAVSEGVQVVTGKIRLEKNSTEYYRISVRPVTGPGIGSPLYLIVFQPLTVVFRQEPAEDCQDTESEEDFRCREIEQELFDTRIYLQNIIHKMEDANEALIASNEETQSMNEELQSANEELESSKEELQATNEELEDLNVAYEKRIEELTRLNNDILNFFRSGRIAMIFLDRQLTIARFTPDVSEVLPIIEADIGRPLTAFANHVDDPQIERRARTVLETLQPIEREFQSLAGRWYLHRILPYRTIEDRIEGIVMTFTDITERKESASALTESMENYRSLFNNMSAGFALCEVLPANDLRATNFRFLTVNHPFQCLFPQHRAELLNKTILEIVPQIDLNLIQQLCQVGITGHPLEIEEYEVSAQLFLNIKAYSPRAHRFALVCTDVTEQRRVRLERQRMEATVMNTQRLESLGVLAGGIAHDFNNLLCGIFGYVELAQKAVGPDSPALPYLNRAQSVFSRAQALSKQLLTFAKGGQPVKRVVQIENILPELVRFSLSGSNIELRTRLAHDIPGCEIDINQISQVIDNIVLNARQAMPEGGLLTVSLEAIDTQTPCPPPLKPGPAVLITFRDTGPGIPSEILPRIFDPFFTTKREGNGLGLATVFSIVVKHGGAIEAHNIPEGGAEFRLYLPAHTRTTDPIEVSPTVLSAKEPGRILIMDDEEFIREILALMLESKGFAVCVARGETETLELYRQALVDKAPFQAVILDLTIPGEQGGLHVLNELRQLHPQLRAIASSGYSDDPVMANPAAFGFIGGLKKPYTEAEVHEFIRHHFAE